MSSNIDPAKLKVVDLRNELSSRGLDTKGNKAVLVKRLKNALEKEFDKDLPDTSIADTSTEELDTSQSEETSEKKDEDLPPEKIEAKADKSDSKTAVSPEKTRSPEKPQISSEKVAGMQKLEVKLDSKSAEIKLKPAETEKPKKEPETLQKIKTPEKVKTSEELKTPEKVKSPEKNAEQIKSPEKAKLQQKSENPKQDMEVDAPETEIGGLSKTSELEPDPPLEKMETEKQEAETTSDTKTAESAPEGMETDAQDVKSKESETADQPEQKGEKRKRTSHSPQRSQRRRSRSPVRENEPVIDNANVQLSWYDSDLHLQVDDKTFLSAKPLTEGVFGYAWAGVRGTHGVESGKVFYELKITEEIKWEDDFSKQTERKNRNKRNSNKKNLDKKTSNVKPDEEKSSEKVESSEKAESGEKAESIEKVEPSEKVETGEKDSVIKEEKIDETPAEPEETLVKKEKVSEEDTIENADDESEIKSADNCEDGSKIKVEPSEQMETEESKSENAESDSKSKEDNQEAAGKPVEVSEPLPTHILRVGWSLIKCNLQLGEEKHSYGYESSGRFVSDKQFVDYGVKFGVGDVIGAFLDIEEDNITLRFSVNGEVQPVANTVAKSDLPEDSVFFPHILSRNYAFELNLGDKEESWFPVPSELEGYQYLSKVEDKVAGPVRPENRADCEVLLMCGLPASGKTHWVTEHVAANPHKRYCVLGKSNMLEKMTVSGEPLKSKYKGRWSGLVDRMQKCLNKLVALAAQRRRNYIIDQTNVFPSAQRRKMRPFEGFKRRAVILVVGDEEQARRQSLQEAVEGKEVPDSTILEMKAAMSLPDKGDWIDDVIYAGVEEAEAKEIVKKYNVKGKEAGYGTEKRFKEDRWPNKRNDYRGRNYRDRGYHSQRYEPRERWGGPRPRGGGGWSRERPDNRGPPAREWRGGARDYHAPRSSYNQSSYNRGPSRGRDQGPVRGGRGQGRGQGWGGGQGGWSQYGSGGGYGGGGQNWGSNGNQWKYGSGGSGGGGNQQGYGGYGGNWNYYGQYSQNWSQK